MQLLESIVVPLLRQGKDDCWFCKEKPKDSAGNDLVEDPESGGGENAPENNVKNDSSSLGRALGNRPNWQIKAPNDKRRTAQVTPGAHHLIPGKASFRDATALHQYVKKDEGLIAADIGYSINSRDNGVWLPGTYGVRAWAAATGNITWSKYGYQDHYAIAAMKASGGQIHDSHPEYSEKVKTRLLGVAEKLDEWREAQGDKKCPVCGEDASQDGKLRPPYGLVGKLNTMSADCRRMLKGGGLRQKHIVSGYRTSDFALLLFPEPVLEEKAN